MFELGSLDSVTAKGVRALCPEGEVALGGGHNIGFVIGLPFPPVSVYQSLPVQDPNSLTRSIGWQMQAAEIMPTDAVWRPIVAAICAPEAP